MKVHVDKQEKKGIFGTSYILEVRMDLTAEEKSLFKEMAGGEIRMIDEHVLNSLPDNMHMKIMQKATLATSLMKGVKLKFPDLRTLNIYQEAFVDGCQTLKNMIENHEASKGDLGTSTTYDF